MGAIGQHLARRGWDGAGGACGSLASPPSLPRCEWGWRAPRPSLLCPQCFRKALAQAPRLTSAMVGLAAALYSAGYIEGAVAVLWRAVAVEPEVRRSGDCTRPTHSSFPPAYPQNALPYAELEAALRAQEGGMEARGALRNALRREVLAPAAHTHPGAARGLTSPTLSAPCSPRLPSPATGSQRCWRTQKQKRRWSTHHPATGSLPLPLLPLLLLLLPLLLSSPSGADALSHRLGCTAAPMHTAGADPRPPHPPLRGERRGTGGRS